MENFENICVNNTNTGGKSTSFFFTTSDEKFIIKTIKKTEKKTLLGNFFMNYINRAMKKESKMVRILGVYKVSPTKQHFIIMENVVPSKQVAMIYDVKGYANDNRKGFGKIMKDSEFISSEIGLKEEVKEKVLQEIKDDVEVLRSCGLMDYSVLIGKYNDEVNFRSRYRIKEHNQLVVIGIIDFLQVFNFRKCAESYIRRKFSKNQISSIKPDLYASRLIDFLSQYL